MHVSEIYTNSYRKWRIERWDKMLHVYFMKFDINKSNATQTNQNKTIERQ